MTALARLIRTTAFKLSLVYLVVFVTFAAFLLGYLAWNTQRLLTDQINQIIDAEITGLVEQYRLGGIRRLVAIIDNRSRQPGSNLYLITSFSGDALAGNIAALAPGVLDHPGKMETIYRRLDDEGTERPALVRVFQLTGGFRLLVGRDLEERQRVREIVFSAARWSALFLVLLGLFSGVFVTRRVLKRVDAMSDTARTIMAGDFSGRLAVSGTADEFDRLAGNLNAMLDRIEMLMRGLEEVSDNIAHDLKTPLTRLRNRCEAALRSAKNEDDYRAALEATIEESEGLIRTFNALLMIARAESGEAREGMAEFDVAETVRGVVELYEPLAEEKGLLLKVDAPSPVRVHGHRELLTQALANLLDNAIKYGHRRDAAAPGRHQEIVLAAREDKDAAVLTVADAGPGIAEQDRGRVIERFVRLEQSRSEPGSGLGLSLAAAVARLHGGRLVLDDNRPGLRVMLTIPRARVASYPDLPLAPKSR